MSEPQGFNPIAEHAPGLPRHDAPLSGHAPGSYTPLSDEASSAPTYSPYTGSNSYSGPSGYSGSSGYGGAEVSPAYVNWAGRIVMAGVIAVTLPLQISLYPIAGAIALAAAGTAYVALHAAGMSPNASFEWSWTPCFFAFLVAMRLETGFENRASWYRMARHCLRLVIVAGWFYYFDRYMQLDSPQTAIIVSIIVAVLTHFILRAQWATGLWHHLQTMLWLRKP